MDDETDPRTLLLWQSVTLIVAGMAVVFLITHWEPIRSWLR